MPVPAPSPRQANPMRPRGARLRRGALRAIAGIVLALAPGLGTAGELAGEHRHKAAFVYIIAAFTHWPQDPAGAMRICLQADAGLEAAIAALAVHASQPVAVVPARAGAGCRVLVRDAATPVSAGADTLVICDACTLPDGASAVALVRGGAGTGGSASTSTPSAPGKAVSSSAASCCAWPGTCCERACAATAPLRRPRQRARCGHGAGAGRRRADADPVAGHPPRVH